MTPPDPTSLEARVPLAGGGLDRADALRKDEQGLRALAAAPETRLAAFWKGKPAIRVDATGVRLALIAPSEALAQHEPDPIFLGFEGQAESEGAARQARFAIDLSALEEDAAKDALAAPGAAALKFADLRSVGPDLSALEAEIAATGRSLLEWRRSHGFCANCGAPSHQAQGGWRRDCPSCGATHFPRTDPVVIMLVLRPDPATGEPRTVLGRQSNWPPGMHSLLAGYVEPGETIEAAVRRETKEEVGVEVGRVRYLASQPWPYPSTLMIGCVAEALTERLTPDLDELEACRWISKTEMAEALAGRHPDLLAPRTDAIAWALIRAWVEGALDEPG
ncbi:MAG: NAD(+) diphosphatase [Pseudomonadota bacterium]